MCSRQVQPSTDTNNFKIEAISGARYCVVGSRLMYKIEDYTVFCQLIGHMPDQHQPLHVRGVQMRTCAHARTLTRTHQMCASMQAA
jgi:hypothetical protein